MSRTDAHVPLRVRVARGDIARAEVHDHTNGMCDLPETNDRDAPRQRRGHCHWTWLWDGHGPCPCETCHGGHANRRERRADRQRVRRELDDAVRRWNTKGNDAIDTPHPAAVPDDDGDHGSATKRLKVSPMS